MTLSFFHPVTSAAHLSREVESQEDLSALLAPVVAGARARGVADAFDLMGVPAILLDRDGQVLHAGRRVAAALDPFVRIAGGHLLGADVMINDRLTAFLSRALAADEAVDIAVEIAAADGFAGIRLQAKRPPAAEPVSCQLLHTIVVIDRIVD